VHFILLSVIVRQLWSVSIFHPPDVLGSWFIIWLSLALFCDLEIPNSEIRYMVNVVEGIETHRDVNGGGDDDNCSDDRKCRWLDMKEDLLEHAREQDLDGMMFNS
jgi:hypothetical protein